MAFLAGTIALYGAAILHFSLALHTLFTRRNWWLPPVEILRLLSGFSLPLLLFGHFVTTRMAMEIYAHDLSYARTITSLLSSGSQGWQLALMAPGWVHGCLGLWITLRRYPLMLALKPALLGFAIALPLLSAAGFGLMARELTGKGLNRTLIEVSLDERAALGQFVATMTNGYLLLLLLTLCWARSVYSCKTGDTCADQPFHRLAGRASAVADWL